MRVLHLIAYSLYSGPVPPTLGLARAQRRRGDDVTLAFDTKRGAINEFEEAAAPVLTSAGFVPPPLVLSTKSSPLELIRDVRALRALIRSHDVVHVHMSHDHMLARIAWPSNASAVRVRTFHSARSLAPRFGQSGLNRFADGWVVRSRSHRELLLSRFGIAPDRVMVIPSGIDADVFSPPSPAARAAARARFQLPVDVRVLGHVALIAGRGQEELASAVAALAPERRPHILYVGRGEYEEALRARVERLGLSAWVRYAGYLQGNDLLAGYAAMDAAFAAQAGNDASARAVLEAMGCGLPVLAVAVDALMEAVAPSRGYLADSRAPEALSQAIEAWLLDDAATFKGQAGRTYVLEERSFAHEAELVAALYARAVDHGRRGVLPTGA